MSERLGQKGHMGLPKGRGEIGRKGAHLGKEGHPGPVE